MQRDRYKLDLFYNPNEPQIPFSSFSRLQEIPEDQSYVSLTLTDPEKLTPKERNRKIEELYKSLPHFKNLKGLQVHIPIKEELFQAICELSNLEVLRMHGSKIESLVGIERLQSLNRLEFERFTQLKDISALLKLSELEYLLIENCFRVENYEIIGEMSQLIGLNLGGDAFAPKNLKLKSLDPFARLGSLRHLDLCHTSIADKNSYLSLLKLKSLLRFDTTAAIKPDLVDEILAHHQTLVAGLITDWDFRKKEIKVGKEW